MSPGVKPASDAAVDEGGKIMHLIQQELDQMAHEWNTHTIRSSKHCLVPAGVPNEVYDDSNRYYYCPFYT